jgi:hypothetical protein
MRSIWSNKTAWLALTLCLTAHADDTSFGEKVKELFSSKPKQAIAVPSSSGLSEKPKGKCVNLLYERWQIVQRLDSGVYEVVTREGRRSCWQNPDNPAINYNPVQCMDIPEGPRVVLITNGDKFESAGTIDSNVWVDITDKSPETIELPQTDGFKKTYRVVRESAACTVYGADLAKKEVEKRKREEIQTRAIAAEEQKKRDADEKRERAQTKKDRAEQEKTEALWK